VRLLVGLVALDPTMKAVLSSGRCRMGVAGLSVPFPRRRHRSIWPGSTLSVRGASCHTIPEPEVEGEKIDPLSFCELGPT